MPRVRSLLALFFTIHAVAHAETLQPNDAFGPLIRELLAAIETLSDYEGPATLPPVFELPQHELEAKVCDTPCNVTAAYVPREGIYLAGHLDPVREPRDRAALLHELVHALQQGHPKFAELGPCEREHAKEAEAYALQNAYLTTLGIHERVVFFEGEFDCPGEDYADASGPAGFAHLTPQQGTTLLELARDMLPREAPDDSDYAGCLAATDAAAADPQQKAALEEALKLVDGASRRMGYTSYTEIDDDYERLRLAKMLAEGPWMRQFKQSLENCLGEHVAE